MLQERPRLLLRWNKLTEHVKFRPLARITARRNDPPPRALPRAPATHGRRVQESSDHSRIRSGAIIVSNKWKPEDISGKTKGETWGGGGWSTWRREGQERRMKMKPADTSAGWTVAGPGQGLPLSRVSLGPSAESSHAATCVRRGDAGAMGNRPVKKLFQTTAASPKVLETQRLSFLIITLWTLGNIFGLRFQLLRKVSTL